MRACGVDPVAAECISKPRFPRPGSPGVQKCKLEPQSTDTGNDTPGSLSVVFFFLVSNLPQFGRAGACDVLVLGAGILAQ